MKEEIEVAIPFENILDALHFEDEELAEKSILRLDQSQGSVQFTFNIIEKLVDTLRVDVDNEDISEFLKKLRRKYK